MGIWRSVGRVVAAGSTAVGRRLETGADARIAARIDSKLEKAMVGSRPGEAQGLLHDPLDWSTAVGYRERPTAASFHMMESVARSVPPVTDVIRTRVLQVNTFLQPQRDRNSPGAKIVPKGKDPDSITAKEEKRGRELMQLMLTTGHPDVPRKDQVRPTSLRELGKMLVRDTLSYDQVAHEVVPFRGGGLAYIRTLDPSTIRLMDMRDVEPGGPYAVQVLQGRVVADFTPDELAFGIRNPRSGIRTYGYGESEIETLVKEVTGLLWGLEYNQNFFKQGSSVRGILNFKGGTIPDTELRRFRRQWHAMVSGVVNAWRTPILNSEEVQWINLQMSNRDMEYSHWIDFLIKVVCARYNIAPEEVNFTYGAQNQSSAMGQVAVEEKLKASRDLGLRPLVHWTFAYLNDYLLAGLDPDYEMIPMGIDGKGLDAELDFHKKLAETAYTVDEVRGMRGDAPLPDGMGACILNPTWLQFYQGKQSMEQGGDEGMDGAPGGDDAAPESGPDDEFDLDETGAESGGNVDPNDASTFDLDAMSKSLDTDAWVGVYLE